MIIVDFNVCYFSSSLFSKTRSFLVYFMMFQTWYSIFLNHISFTCTKIYNIILMCSRAVCPNFGHPDLQLRHAQNINLSRWKIVLQQLWIDRQFWNCFSFRMIIFYFRSEVSEVRAHYPGLCWIIIEK